MQISDDDKHQNIKSSMHHAAKRRRTTVNAPTRSFDLTITGEACRVQQKTQLSESGHLIQLSYNNASSSIWNNTASDIDEGDGGSHDTRKQPTHLLVDRYDARTLMDEISLQQLCNQRLGPSFNTDGVIKASYGCRRRAGEVKVDKEGFREEIDQRNIERTTISKTDVKKSESGQEINDEPLFQPTEEERRSIPNDVLLPRTLKQHNIIELTAGRVANNPQLEIFLKLKQSNNTQLSFINPADELHPYYLHLKGKCTGENQASDDAKSVAEERKGGLNMLLAGYESSSSDEDTGKEVTELKDQSAPACTASIPKQQTNNEHKIRRDERLERLRQWKKLKNI